MFPHIEKEVLGMQELLLILSLIGFAVYGSRLMGKVDCFVEENQERTQDDNRKEDVL